MFAKLYEIGIQLFLLFARLAAKMNSRVNDFFKAREVTEPEAKSYKWWVHCASYGEYEMAVPLLQKMGEQDGYDSILVSFFSPSGYEQVQRKSPSHAICYVPLDTRKSVSNFYTKYQPQKAVFVRYELWYQLIKEGIKRKIPFHLMNARFGKGHFAFRPLIGKPYLKLLKRFVSVSASDKVTTSLLSNKGITQAHFTGDTRYDRVKDIQNQAKSYPLLESFKGEQKMLVMGSTYFYEERIVQEILHDLPEFKIVIAPHTIDDQRLQEIETLFSEYRPKRWTAQDIKPEDRLVILDTIGMLSTVYRYADVSFVGGGFTGALHNIIEPAVWGGYVLFGPLVQKYPEAAEFVSAGIADVVDSSGSFEQCINRQFSAGMQEEQTTKSSAFIDERLGATEKIWAQLI